MLNDLIVPSLLPYQFDAKVQTAIDGMTVTEFLNGKTNVTSILTKQIEVISDSEPKFAAELGGNSPQQLPQPLWEALRKILTDKDYIKDITKLNHARSKLMGLMNERIGQDPEIDIKKLRDITVGTNLVKEGASWGSIFEAWCLNNWAKLFEDPQKKLPLVVNKGKATFYFNVTKNAEGKEISRTLAALNVITDKKRIIDCSYIVNNETLIPEGRDCNRVLVELKHTQGKLEEDTFDQLRDNVMLLGKDKKNQTDKKIKRIEYVFSTQKTAADNNDIFLLFFDPLDQKNTFDVFYINDSGEKIRYPITVKKK